MSCCGNKRQSLNFFPAINQVKKEDAMPARMNSLNSKKNTEAVFRYTGNTSLEVKSLFAERKYFFSADQPLLSVFPDDAAMMRAYSELNEMNP
jgi:hypothetical protein